MSNTLYGGDRAGSRYYWVMENTAATETGNYTSVNPGFRNRVQAFQLNPFVKARGLEVFGVIERAEGKASAEATERVWKQYAIDTVYRFLPDEAAYVGVRYNKATGTLAETTGGAGRESLAGRRRLVRDREHPRQGGVRDPEVRGLPGEPHPQRRQVQRFMLEGVVGF